MQRFLPQCLGAGACCVAALVAASAQAADPVVSQVVPQGGQRGSEVAIQLRGDRVGLRPEGLLFYEAGIELVGIEAKKPDVVEAKLRLTDACPLGRHALRLRTATGLSNLVTFHVGALPETVEAEPNDRVDQAQPIAYGAVVNGVVEQEETDCFVVDLQAGQRLAVEVEGLRLGRTLFDPYVELLGPGGDRLAKCDDSPATHQDPSFVVDVPADGLYTIRLRESALRGDQRCTYRMHLGDFARPDAIYPP
ncbi:MAG: PPC domain-containing protein, partial [Planctomycetota bacterium]